ncbi:hypothetical protein V6N11_017411 [Hibiscus sabdariffa]|uniref:Transposase MuDR plant domain-containing protein n=1 Tax=Hibiscus sabdariffa TaxID=183260 RepID=A0ABR2TYK1_9ROSI
MVKVLGITYTMRVYWEVSINPFEIALLANDVDVLEMVSNLSRNHYVHVYLDDVANLANSATIDEDIVNDTDHVEHVDRIDGDFGSKDSDSEDSDYDKFDFSDSKNDYENEVSDVGVSVNVDSGDVEGNDEVRAKNLALEKLHGNLNEQYTKLYDYLVELRSSNPETTTIPQLDESVFKRLYTCMLAMKDGFKAGCRPIICMDGYHLKRYYECHTLKIP